MRKSKEENIDLTRPFAGAVFISIIMAGLVSYMM